MTVAGKDYIATYAEPASLRALCAVCARSVRLRIDGTTRKHRGGKRFGQPTREPARAWVCIGSGHRPLAPVERDDAEGSQRDDG